MGIGNVAEVFKSVGIELAAIFITGVLTVGGSVWVNNKLFRVELDFLREQIEDVKFAVADMESRGILRLADARVSRLETRCDSSEQRLREVIAFMNQGGRFTSAQGKQLREDVEQNEEDLHDLERRTTILEARIGYGNTSQTKP